MKKIHPNPPFSKEGISIEHSIQTPFEKGACKKDKRTQMLYYQPKNKKIARSLRSNQTDAEQLLWSRIRRKQIKNIQFCRQKPIENFIVDFYAPAAKLVIEIDGSQHFEEIH